jgi:hypothetical protein
LSFIQTFYKLSLFIFETFCAIDHTFYNNNIFLRFYSAHFGWWKILITIHIMLVMLLWVYIHTEPAWKICLATVGIEPTTSEFEGAFEEQTHILTGPDKIFKKVLLFAHAVVIRLLPPPPGDSPPSQKGGDIPRNIAPVGEYPRNIAPI